jgi:hypothetical protein
VRTPVLTDDQIDDLFAGTISGTETAELVRLLGHARETLLECPDEQVERRHLAAILLLSNGVRDSDPETRAPVPDGKRTAGRFPALGPVWVRAAAAALATAVALGALGALGHLPDPMQSAVARIARTFGISLKNPGEADRLHQSGTGGSRPVEERPSGNPSGGEETGPGRGENPPKQSRGTPPDNRKPKTTQSPAETRKPDGSQPEDAGNPDETESPEDDPSNGNGPPEEPGPPDGNGPPEEHGPPDGNGPPEDAGPPAGTGNPNDPSSNGP